jgi:AcrR family transcriptional regulator
MTSTEHSGSGDLQRTLELLWGPPDRAARGPKPGLTLDQIVTAAIAVADEEGLGALSMRRVAAVLGVGTMSLYRYVPGKSELLDLMLDRVAGEDGDPRCRPDAGWRALLEDFAHGVWALHHRHPWLLQVDQARPLLGPNSLRGVESILAGLAGIGLTGREMVSVLVMVDSYVTGTARTYVNAANAEKRTGISDAEFWAAQTPMLEKAMATGGYPALAGLPADAWTGPADHFEFGLRRLLDGLAAYLASRTAS